MSALRHLGKILSIAGWVGVILAVVFLYIIPFVQEARTAPYGVTGEFASSWIMQNYFTVHFIVQLLTVFIPLGLAIWSGQYVIAYAREREFHKEEQLLGFLKSYGRISLADLSSRLNLSVVDTERYLASIRGKRDVVFSISDGVVIMPGFERSRPIKEIEKITREVVAVPCKYCSALIPMGSSTCPECGAVLRART